MILGSEPLTAPAHIEIIGLIFIPIVGFWLNWRIEHRKDAGERMRQHIENRERLKTIETKLDPLWQDWNDRKRNGGRS